MLNSFLAMYEKGYAAGLRRATAMSGEQNTFQEAVDYSSDELIEVVSRPAYQEGFADGFRDGLQVLAESPIAILASPWGKTSRFAIEVMNMVLMLRQALREFFCTVRRRRERVDDGVARLREALGRAEVVVYGFPAEGTEAFLAYRWAYEQLVSLVASARQALA